MTDEIERVATGWVVGDADGKHWRSWGDSGPIWVSDLNQATQYHRRCDAEPFAWAHRHPKLQGPTLNAKPLPRGADELGWTETPLYTADQLQAYGDARAREALERAIDNMGWPEIHAFEDELRKGQGVREDAGGFMLRAVKALFGLKPDTVETYRDAMRAMLKENPNG